MRDTEAPLKVGLVIGKLGFGGAESQLIRLGRGLIERGHNVSLLCYDGSSVRDKELESAGAYVVTEQQTSKLGKINQFRKWQAAFSPDIVHAFMKRASMVAVLGRGWRRRYPVIASDLSTATYNRRSPSLWPALVLFGQADLVTTQTRLNEKSLHMLAPWLRKKTIVIRNGIDTDAFMPLSNFPENSPFRFAVVGSVYRVKNPIGVVKATAILAEEKDLNFVVDWYGRKGLKGDEQPSEEFKQADQLVRSLGIERYIRFHGETKFIVPAYQRSHCLLHASFQEGFPNAVVEGMACGLPIAVSRVSDLPMVVEEAKNGFLFDERSPESIAEAMRLVLAASKHERIEMGRRSRELAIRWFGLQRFICEYEDLYRNLVGKSN